MNEMFGKQKRSRFIVKNIMKIPILSHIKIYQMGDCVNVSSAPALNTNQRNCFDECWRGRTSRTIIIIKYRGPGEAPIGGSIGIRVQSKQNRWKLSGFAFLYICGQELSSSTSDYPDFFLTFCECKQGLGPFVNVHITCQPQNQL